MRYDAKRQVRVKEKEMKKKQSKIAHVADTAHFLNDVQIDMAFLYVCVYVYFFDIYVCTCYHR